MKKFLAVFKGSASSREKSKWDTLSEVKRNEMIKSGMEAWGKWVAQHQKSIVDYGSPLGKTQKVDRSGLSKIVNQDTAYVIVQADSHDEAARLFIEHPHFMIFPGDSVEIMECLPMPGVVDRGEG